MSDTIKKDTEDSDRKASKSKDEKSTDVKQKKSYETPAIESHSPLESVSSGTTYQRGVVD
jgi:hypothetical protein